MIKTTTAWALLLCGAAAQAYTVFESDGSSMEGWKTQYHASVSKSELVPVWESDGRSFAGGPFYSPHLDEELGGTLLNTNSFRMEVGDVATLTMDFEGHAVPAPDNLNHWWFTFGFRTGGEEAWIYGDLAAYATFRAGSGPESSTGFALWNSWADSWTEPYPRCTIAADADYWSDPLTITFVVERTATGFGPSAITVSNHVTGVRSMALSMVNQANENNCASSNLYFFCRIPPKYDGPNGFSAIGSRIRIRNLRLTVEKGAPRPIELMPATPGGEPKVAVVQPLFRSIQAIKELSNREAGKNYPARISGQVLNLYPKHSRLFIHDGLAGLYVELEKAAQAYDGLKVGSMVRLEGETQSGGYSPILFAHAVEVTGWKPLPRARRLSRTLHRSTHYDVDWVEVEGRPISMEFVKSYGHYLITMEVFHQTEGVDKILEVFIPYAPDAAAKMKAFMFRQVYLPGIIGTTANQQQQMTGRILYANSVDDFRLIPEFTGKVPREYPIHELMQYGKDTYGLVKTRGRVTRATPDTLYLRGEKGSLKASIYREGRIRPGDLVELAGYVDIQPVSPAFRTVDLKKIEAGPAPEPVDVALGRDAIQPDWNYELIRLDAEFMYEEKTFTQRRFNSGRSEFMNITRPILWCRAGPRLIEARLPSGQLPPQKLRPGSRLQLTGICHISKTKNPRLDQMIDSLWLELADASSIRILRQASWWTPGRLLGAFAITLGGSVLLLFWIVALRKTVASQTRTISEQIVRESTLNERQRIARELHDTLEQGLTALSMQIKRIRRGIGSGASKASSAVETAERMIRVCREESRASIQDLRGGLLEEMSLPEAIEHKLRSGLEELPIKLRVEVQGRVKRLPLFAEHQLFRIVAEAATNAMQHAEPGTLLIRLTYHADLLEIRVQDDGCGFEPDQIDASERFGVQGMYERAYRLGGTLSIESEPGKGTSVCLTVPTEKLHEEARL